MFCTVCGHLGAPGESYCAQCGERYNRGGGVAAPPLSALRYFTSGIGIGTAACAVIAICTTYSFTGADAHPTTLHDTDSALAFNIVLTAALLLASLLVLLRATARLGLGMAVGAGVVYPSLFVANVASMFRSSAHDTSGYIAPGVGFYWGIVSAALAIAAAVSAAITLRRSGDIRLAPTKTSSLWAVIALLCTVAWVVGTWLPWQKQVLTATAANGTAKSITYGPCCSLSHEPAQWAVQAVTTAVLIAVVCLIAVCLRSASTASGILLAACVFSAGDVMSVLWSKPYTLAELAPGLEMTETQLRQANAVVVLHNLPGVWITSAASLGLLLLTVARGVHAASAASHPALQSEASHSIQ
ncbi:hypothetical protein [Streptomyces mirabilis]|uniref:hypothetical protein n=1 Tax=Streptomyces mirabilis TaxID=68239 RepID=UPI00367443CA